MLTLIAIVSAVVVVTILANWKLKFFRWDLIEEIREFNQELSGRDTEKNNQPVVVAVSDTVTTTEPTEVSVRVETEPQRARNSSGQFIGDDPTTQPINEAWVGGTAPARKRTSKPAAKKGAAPKPKTKK